jgi:hypothetical protein
MGAQRCSGCGESLGDPLAKALDPEQLARQNAKRRVMTRAIGGVVAVVLIGGIGFAVVQSTRTEARNKQYRELQEEFLRYEKAHMGTFWKCVLGTPMDITNFQDNLAIASTMENAFVRRPREYTQELTSACGPTAAAAATKMKLLKDRAVGDFGPNLDKYIEAANGLTVASAKAAENLKERIAAAEAEPVVMKAADIYHQATRGKPGVEQVAYDKYLLCAVPGVDGMADIVGVAKAIYEACRADPGYSAKLTSCAKELEPPHAKPDKAMLARFKKLGPDDNDTKALEDCFKRAKRAKGKDPFEPLSRATVEFLNARAGLVNSVRAAVTEGQDKKH